MPKPSTIVCTSTHSVTLADGTDLAPGEARDDVDMDALPNRGLLLDGHINVVDGFKPRSRKLTEVLADDPAVESKEQA